MAIAAPQTRTSPEVSPVAIGDLLREDLRIPHYQRPYTWEAPMALQLLDDTLDAHHGAVGSRAYVLGAVVLHDGGDGLDVVDGQQRLLTLRMLLGLLGSVEEVDLPPDGSTPVSRVWGALSRRVARLGAKERHDLSSFLEHRCQVVRIVTTSLDEAFRIFDSQNYRGKPLLPHDLLKAYHLRAMRNELPAQLGHSRASDASTTAVVEAWESVGEDDLHRLFATYLYRIVCWSRGESAEAFDVRDIDLFKGIDPGGGTHPAARYHLAAQTALPMLTSWQGPSGHDRDTGRTRFQLDAPVVAGRTFFEMVTFMLDELHTVRQEAFPPEWEPFASLEVATSPDGSLLERRLQERPGKSRYRYVTELYLAAVLYYVNKFGTADVEAAREHLFGWAFSLRAGMQRVQYRSVDNLARGRDGVETSAFTLLRHAPSGRVVSRLPASSTPYSGNEEHEHDLVKVLRGIVDA